MATGAEMEIANFSTPIDKFVDEETAGAPSIKTNAQSRNSLRSFSFPKIPIGAHFLRQRRFFFDAKSLGDNLLPICTRPFSQNGETFARKFPEAALLRLTSSGSFDCVVAVAPTPLKMTWG